MGNEGIELVIFDFWGFVETVNFTGGERMDIFLFIRGIRFVTQRKCRTHELELPNHIYSLSKG
jgi:hypothetical protein